MADLVEELVIRVRTDGTVELKKLAGDVENLGRVAATAGTTGAAGMRVLTNATDALRSSLLAMISPLAVVTAVVLGFKKAISAAAEADQSMRQLANTLQLVGSSMEKDGARVEAAIGRIFKSSLYSDETLRDAFRGLVTMTGDLERALKALPVAADLAAKTNMDLESSTRLIGLATEGATRGLKQLGISFTAAENAAFLLMDESRRLDIVLGLINEKTSGASRANVESWGAALKQAGKDLNELWEKVGGWIFRALQAMDVYFKRLKAAIRDALGLPTIESGGSTSVGIAKIMSGNEARAELAKGVAAGIIAGAKDAAPKAAKIITDELRRIPGLMYPGPQSLADVFAGHPGTGGGGMTAQMVWLLRQQEDWARNADQIFEDLRSGLSDAAIAAAREFAEQASREFAARFREPMTDIFADLALTGGRNFGQIAGQMFENAVRDSASGFVDMLSGAIDSILGGGGISEGPGGFTYGGRTYQTRGEAQAAQAQRRAQWGSAIGAGVGVVAGTYQGARSGETSLLGGTLSGAAAGATFGWIGAVVGAVLGFVGSWLGSQARYDTYQYARPGFRGGRAYLSGVDDITSNEQKEMLARMQATFDEFRNGYIQILMKFPAEFRVGLMDAVRSLDNLMPQFGLDAGGDIGNAASQNFMKHFNQWVSGGLPRDIAEAFFEPLAAAFQSVGMGEGRFRQIWDQLQDLDPRKAMELLGVLAEGLLSIREAMEHFRMASGFGASAGGWSGGGFGETVGLRAVVQQMDRRSFAETLAETDQEIIDLADSLSMLTGEDQIRTVQRIGQLMSDRYDREVEYIRQLNNMITASGRQIEQAIQGYTVAGLEDPQAQIDYLNSLLPGLYQSLAGASTPELAQYFRDQIFDIINQIAGIGMGQGGENVGNYSAWAIEALRELNEAFNLAIDGFGASIDDANERLVNAVGPMIDSFLEVDGAASGAAENLNSVSDAAGSAAANLTLAAQAAADFASAVDPFSNAVRADRAA